MRITSLKDIRGKLSQLPKCTIAIAQAADLDMLEVMQESVKQGLAGFILIGNELKIRQLAESMDCPLDGVELIDCQDEAECARTAVSLVKCGRASMPMKGLLPTAAFMRAVLDKECGLRTSKLISQISITEHPDSNSLIYITDCAMNISPDLTAKKQIIENAVMAANALGNPCPKVAVITALETVNEAMPETMDAAILSKMNERGQIKSCIIDGPFALDNAVSSLSAKHKGIGGSVAGKGEIFLMSDIRMGNVFHKSLTYFAKKQVASVIMGTSSPIIMTSRSDSVADKVNSIAFSCYLGLVLK